MPDHLDCHDVRPTKTSGTRTAEPHAIHCVASPAQRILIVDDEPALLDILVEQFINSPYEIETAATGADALCAVRRERPDVVLLDIKMPAMNGLEVLKEIKKIDRSITVIVVSGISELPITDEAFRNDAFGYVPKPFDFRYLQHLVSVTVSE
jgi:two-component system, response regulator, stage 0 sporulation protein F